MKTTWLVCYDICNDKRLRKVYKTCRGYGRHLQYSVFECDLTPTDRVAMERKLTTLINHGEDQVLFVSLGPAEGRGSRVIQALGLPYHEMDSPCYVV